MGERTGTMTQDNDSKSGVTLAIKKFIDMVVSANFIVLIYFLTTSGERPQGPCRCHIRHLRHHLMSREMTRDNNDAGRGRE